jgi:hypothetical protein
MNTATTMLQNAKQTAHYKVGLAFTTNYDGLELVWLDTKTGDIVQAGHASISCINPSTRVLEDPDALVDTVQALYTSLEVPFGLNATLSLPSLYSRKVTLPASLTDSERTVALLSEAERSVLFKRSLPQVDWVTLGTNAEDEHDLLLTAYPQEEILKLLDCFGVLQIPLVGIDTGITSTLKGLAITNTLEDDEAHRLFCHIGYSSFFIASLEGARLRDGVEIPLPTQGATEEQIVSEIEHELQALLQVVGTQSSVVVVFIEQYGESIASLGANNGLYPCTLEALGATQFEALEALSPINLIPLEKQNATYVSRWRKQFLIGGVALNVLVLVLVLLINSVYWLGNTLKQGEVAQLEKQVQSQTAVGINQETLLESMWINKNIAFNEQVLTWLLQLEKTIKSNVWLEELTLTLVEGKATLSAKGGAKSPDAITAFRSLLKPAFIKEEPKVGNVEKARLTIDKDGTKTLDFSTTDAAANPDAETVTYYKWRSGDESGSGGSP